MTHPTNEPSRTKTKPGVWRGLQSVLANAQGQLMHLIAFSLVINLLILALPLFMIQVFDRVLSSHSVETLTVLALGAAAALTVMAILDLTRSRILVRLGQWIEAALSPDLIRGGRYERLDDVSRVRAFVQSPAMGLLLDAPWTPVFLGIIFLLHPALGWIALSGAAVLLAVAIVSERLLRTPLLAQENAAAEDRHFRGAMTNDDGGMIVHGMAARVAEKWIGAQAESWSHQQSMADRTHSAAALGRFLRLMLQVGLMAAAAGLVIDQQITAGAMVAAAVIAARAFGPVERSIDVWRSLVQVRVSLARLLKTQLREEADSEGFPAAGRTELEVRRIGVMTRDGVEPLFAGVAFKVKGGEMLGVSGPTGAGKSTLARILTGIERPHQGRVLLDGMEIAGPKTLRAPAGVGYMGQMPQLFPGTVRENIARLADAPLDEVQAAARMAGVEADILALPDGYATRVGPGGHTLSAGLERRIVFARALFGRPRLLVLDEPYTFMDNAGVEHMATALDDLRRDGAAVVLISQRPSLLARCDRVLALQNGQSRVLGRRRKADLKVLTAPPKRLPPPDRPAIGAEAEGGNVTPLERQDKKQTRSKRRAGARS